MTERCRSFNLWQTHAYKYTQVSLRLSVCIIICLSPPITALNVARHAIQAEAVYFVLAKSEEQ